MTDFDRIYHMVAEMNRDWAQLITDIRSGRKAEQRAAERHRVPVVDHYTGAEYGTIIIDGMGALRGLDLEAYEVSQSNESDVLAAIIAALNALAAKPQVKRTQELSGGSFIG
ncbi:hypothetical protein IU443_07530 [Nocardia farcinica]|uniref:hypothetical protein n=1 Tax=Nocardia farcinica TaxID=37329 RepID=UPI0018939BA6|nr:hypothetical protein [Nocardia farcinica]MBF6257916.1 hypothetical protein [Nocardia farcinica]MBF6262725.1 hypothetical protein [Nocardia farcinica]MBF6270090.1 hypothetical protein [Nocardia farcinica]MBF6281229.1 hypothetical protein [Nocardia farcinica]MBF6293113.1 hypothetical protein [Nocardia farcinica]